MMKRKHTALNSCFRSESINYVLCVLSGCRRGEWKEFNHVQRVVNIGKVLTVNIKT